MLLPLLLSCQRAHLVAVGVRPATRGLQGRTPPTAESRFTREGVSGTPWSERRRGPLYRAKQVPVRLPEMTVAA